MLLKIIRFLRGSVDFTASGKFPERFMNITAKNGVNLWNPVPKKNAISASMYLSDYKKIRMLARKSRVKTRITAKHGLPFIINRYKKRTGLFAGAVCGIILCIFLSNFIWSVKISGTEEISNTYLESLLGDNGISVGVWKNNLDTDQIERNIQLKCDDIRWMSINIMGSLVTVEVKETYKKPKLVVTKSPAVTNFFVMYKNFVKPYQKNGVYGHGRERYDKIINILEKNNSYTKETAWEALVSASQAPNPNDITSNTQWSIVYDNTNLTADISIRRDWNTVTKYSLKENKITE